MTTAFNFQFYDERNCEVNIFGNNAHFNALSGMPWVQSDTERLVNPNQMRHHNHVFVTSSNLQQRFEDLSTFVREPFTIQIGDQDTPAIISDISREYYMPWLKDVRRWMLLFGFAPYYFVELKNDKRKKRIKTLADKLNLSKSSPSNGKKPKGALKDVFELIEDGVSGLLVPPEDPGALAEASGRRSARSHWTTDRAPAPHPGTPKPIAHRTHTG